MTETFDTVPPEGGCYYIDAKTGRAVRIPDWSHLPPPPSPTTEPAAQEEE